METLKTALAAYGAATLVFSVVWACIAFAKAFVREYRRTKGGYTK